MDGMDAASSWGLGNTGEDDHQDEFSQANHGFNETESTMKMETNEFAKSVSIYGKFTNKYLMSSWRTSDTGFKDEEEVEARKAAKFFSIHEDRELYGQLAYDRAQNLRGWNSESEDEHKDFSEETRALAQEMETLDRTKATVPSEMRLNHKLLASYLSTSARPVAPPKPVGSAQEQFQSLAWTISASMTIPRAKGEYVPLFLRRPLAPEDESAVRSPLLIYSLYYDTKNKEVVLALVEPLTTDPKALYLLREGNIMLIKRVVARQVENGPPQLFRARRIFATFETSDPSLFDGPHAILTERSTMLRGRGVPPYFGELSLYSADLCHVHPSMSQVCQNCGKHAERGKLFARCARCRFACYCSPRCQMEAWEVYHEGHCSHIAQVNSVGVKPTSNFSF